MTPKERIELMLPIMNNAYEHWYNGKQDAPMAYTEIGESLLKTRKDLTCAYVEKCHDYLISDRELASFAYAWLKTLQEDDIIPIDL